MISTGATMDAAIVLEWTKVLVVIAGVAVGTYAVFSPSYVWHRKQIFTIGSGVLCAFGTILVLGSLYKDVTLSVGRKHKYMRERVEQEIKDVQIVAAEAKESAVTVSSAISTLEPQKIAQL